MSANVSIIMGIYNCAETLPEAIESILNQTYLNWELIMCDDGSSDDTWKIAIRYAEKYPDKIKILKNESNKGLNYTLNRCLKKATGKYIARMDGDDISMPERLEKEVNFLEEHEEYAIVSTPMIYFDECGEWGEGKAIEIPKLRDFVFHPPFHCHAPCMIRKEAYDRVGGYTVDKRLLRYEDCNLWYKLYSKGYRGYNLQEALYKMRDDRNAFQRRTISSRLRAVYVQYNGFRMIHMPIKYYPYLVIEMSKSIVVGLMPKVVYDFFHKKRRLKSNV